MKILFTGGGTGGHFYPLIAIAEKVNDIIDEEKILKASLIYMSDSAFDRDALLKIGLHLRKLKQVNSALIFRRRTFLIS